MNLQCERAPKSFVRIARESESMRVFRALLLMKTIVGILFVWKPQLPRDLHMESRFDHFSFSCVEEFMYVQQFIVVCCRAWNTNILWIMAWITHPFSYTPSHHLVQTNFHCKTKFISKHNTSLFNQSKLTPDGTLGVNTVGMEVLFIKKEYFNFL